MSLTPRIDNIDANYIINGNFDFWQRATSQAFSAGSIFASCDRFRPSVVLATGAGTFSRSTNVPDSDSVYSARFAVTTAQASMSTTDSLRMVHFIEGNFLKPLIGKDATLAFHFRTNKAGIYSVAIQNNGATATYVAQFTVSSAEASGQSWVQRVINFNLPNVGWNKDSNRGMSIVITFADGTTINQAPSLNSWNSGSHTWYPGQVNMVDTIGNFAEISKIMLIEGTHSAPQFSTAGLTYADELRLCQRYYEKSYDLDVIPGSLNSAGSLSFSKYTTSSSQTMFCVRFAVIKRAAPSVNSYDPVNGNIGSYRDGNGNPVGASYNKVGLTGFFIISIASTSQIGLNNENSVQWIADAEL